MHVSTISGISLCSTSSTAAPAARCRGSATRTDRPPSSGAPSPEQFYYFRFISMQPTNSAKAITLFCSHDVKRKEQEVQLHWTEVFHTALSSQADKALLMTHIILEVERKGERRALPGHFHCHTRVTDQGSQAENLSRSQAAARVFLMSAVGSGYSSYKTICCIFSHAFPAKHETTGHRESYYI